MQDNNIIDYGEELDEEVLEKTKDSFEEGIGDISNAFAQYSEDDFKLDGDFELTREDIQKSIGDSSISPSGFELSDEDALILLKLINKIKNNKIDINNINVYNEFPDTLKGMIDNYIRGNFSGKYVTVNTAYRTVRNGLARSLLGEFITYINITHAQDNLANEMEKIFKEMGTSVSKYYKEYNVERDKYLKQILVNIPDTEENKSKRELVAKCMDAIADSYDLNRIKEAIPNLKKIRKIELEKPNQRVFGTFEAKYRESPINIYSLDVAYNTLCRHNKDKSKTDNLTFMITFCKFCKDYDPNVLEEHNFMFYTLYNLVMLDIYKGEEYNEFAPKLLENINYIIDNVKSD